MKIKYTKKDKKEIAKCCLNCTEKKCKGDCEKIRSIEKVFREKTKRREKSNAIKKRASQSNG